MEVVEPDPADTTMTLASGRTTTVREQVLGWSAHVDRIRRELGGPSDQAWGADDLVAALLIRDRVEQALTELGEAVRLAVTDEVARADEVYRGFTVDDRSGALQAVADHGGSDQGWWWFRTPAGGPVREELDAWCGSDRPGTAPRRG